MKTTKLLGLLLLWLVIPFSFLFGQETIKSYWIHQDNVKPSMVQEYEKVGKELIQLCKDNNFDSPGWIALVTNDFRYSFISPLESMADLDQNSFGDMYNKVGATKMNQIWSRMDKCYTDHVNYVLDLDVGLSYQPGGISQTPAGQNYRKNTIYYVSPENYEKGNEIAKKFLKLHTDKGSKMHYRVYRSGFGANGTYFMVAVAASDPAAYEKMSEENRKLLGAEGQALFQELMSIISGMETTEGWMRPDLAYQK